MLAVGRALMSKPDLLLLDEPSLGLQPMWVTRTFEAIREINRKGLLFFWWIRMLTTPLRSAIGPMSLKMGGSYWRGKGANSP